MINNLLRFCEKEEKQAVMLTFFTGIALYIINMILFKGMIIQYTLFTAVSVIIAFAPLTYFQYRSYRISKEIESKFSYFLIGIAEGLESNMSLPNAMKYAAKNDYGALNPYIGKAISQISWGMPLEKVLSNLAEELKNPVITRSVSTIIETYQSGGDIAASLSAVARSVTEIEKIRSERSSRLSGNILQSYIIYFVFIAIVVGIQQFLLPIFMGSGFSILSSQGYGADLSRLYSVRFRDLAVIQGIFSGLIIGKLSSGSLSSGLKHSAVMVSVGYVVLTVSHALI